MRIPQDYWSVIIQSLFVAAGGLMLYVVGVTDALRTLGAALCAVALVMIVLALTREVIRAVWKD